jgi:hypothetical protein
VEKGASNLYSNFLRGGEPQNTLFYIGGPLNLQKNLIRLIRLRILMRDGPIRDRSPPAARRAAARKLARTSPAAARPADAQH